MSSLEIGLREDLALGAGWTAEKQVHQGLVLMRRRAGSVSGKGDEHLKCSRSSGCSQEAEM